MTGIEIVIDDLGSQVAAKAVELASWKARAILAEDALRKIAEEAEAEEAEGLQLVEDSDDDDAEDNE